VGAEVTAEAVVLRRSESGETDRRLTLLTRAFGKIDVVAKGARKPGSRLAGSSEPLVRATFTWAEGRMRRFVTQVQPLTSYPRIRSDYDRTMAALALAELTAVGVPYESPQFDTHDLFDLLVESLSAIESADDWKPALVWAESRLMDAEGVHPEWTTCAVSGRDLAENPAWVSATAGGYVAAAESTSFGDRFAASAEALIALKRVVALDAPPSKLKGADECLRIMFAFWRHALENRLPANEALVQGLPV
jgi:DNA repair protein RecO (recombination protein O)